MRYIASGVAVLAFSACAVQPVQSDSATAAQPPPPASEVAAVASAPVARSPETHSEGSALASALSKDTHDEAVSLVSAAAGIPAEGTDQEAIDLAKARKLGYRIVDKNGETVYCHDTNAAGSHVLKETICLTKKQWETVSAYTARAVDRMQGKMSTMIKGGR